MVKAKLKKGEEVRGMMLVTDMVLDVVKVFYFIILFFNFSYFFFFFSFFFFKNSLI